jgi:hypothetical protein
MKEGLNQNSLGTPALKFDFYLKVCRRLQLPSVVSYKLSFTLVALKMYSIVHIFALG